MRWDRHFLQLALDCARMSKDPSTRVGAVIVGPDREILSTGFNGLPRGIADTKARLEDRATKLKLIVHAEMNAVLAAARNGVRIKGASLYVAASDASGLVWGGPPCTRCLVETMQAGIIEFVSFHFKDAPSRWADDLALARQLIDEAGLTFREIDGRADPR